MAVSPDRKELSHVLSASHSQTFIAAGILLVLASIAVIAVACGDGSEDESAPQAGAVSEKYGVLHQAGVSERAVIGIDKEGAVRYIDVSPTFTDIPDTQPCLTALKGS